MIWYAAHFNKIAKVIREKREGLHQNTKPPNILYDVAKERLLNELTLEFAEFFKRRNPNFNVDQFIKRCGYVARG
jgi:hypothetical protein